MRTDVNDPGFNEALTKRLEDLGRTFPQVGDKFTVNRDSPFGAGLKKGDIVTFHGFQEWGSADGHVATKVTGGTENPKFFWSVDLVLDLEPVTGDVAVEA
jgi:hypothetical protein